jgi:signal transduction histidine kinase
VEDARPRTGAYRVAMRAFGRLHRTVAGAVHGHPYSADAAVAAVAYCVTLLTTLGSLRPWRGQLSVAEMLVAGVACGALVLRRRRPFAVLVVATAGATIYAGLSGAHGWVLAAPLVGLYSAAEATGRRRALTVGWLVVLTLALAHALARPVRWFGSENLALIALGGLAVAAGDAARSRRAYLAEVEERARSAERNREREAGRRVTEERLRIARDLHDSMGHHLALINVQAGATVSVIDEHPDQARRMAELIGRASRAALEELSGTVGLLRQPGDPVAPTGPAGLAALDDLIASFAGSGLRIEQEVDGPACPLPAAADVTAYRVVEESLTNVRKHAGNAAVRIRLTYGPTTLRILVENDRTGGNGGNGGTGPPAEAGHGIAGMRERVAAAGGHLNVGPQDGGFRVSVLLPLPEAGGLRS